MPEEIKHFVKPIAVIPLQSLAHAKVVELERQLARTRKKEARDHVEMQLRAAKLRHNEILIKLGREQMHHGV